MSQNKEKQVINTKRKIRIVSSRNSSIEEEFRIENLIKLVSLLRDAYYFQQREITALQQWKTKMEGDILRIREDFDMEKICTAESIELLQLVLDERNNHDNFFLDRLPPYSSP